MYELYIKEENGCPCMDIMVQFNRNKTSSNSSVWRACYSKISRRKRQNVQNIQKTKSSLATKVGHQSRKQSVPEIKIIKSSRRRKRLSLHGHHGTIQLRDHSYIT